MNEVEVMLSQAEVFQAALVGVQRQTQNLFVGRQDAHGAGKDNGWSMHIDGACAEMAVAKWSGRYWSGNLGNLKAGDVGRLEVRSTNVPNGRLRIHPDDPDDRAFVLVICAPPKFRLIGWEWGRACKRPEFWTDPQGGRPAFFVPQRLLRPMVLPSARAA